MYYLSLITLLVYGEYFCIKKQVSLVNIAVRIPSDHGRVVVELEDLGLRKHTCPFWESFAILAHKFRNKLRIPKPYFNPSLLFLPTHAHTHFYLLIVFTRSPCGACNVAVIDHSSVLACPP